MIKPIRTRALSEEAKICIRKYINSMDLEKDNKLPNEDLLADQLGVSRITIRSALNELASEGIVVRKQGKGTFVNPEGIRIKVQLNPVSEFKQMIIDSGFDPSVSLVGFEETKVSKPISDMLKLEEGTDILVMKKVFYAGDHPCVYCIDYMSRNILPTQTSVESIYEYDNSVFEFLSDVAKRTVAWDKVEILTANTFENQELEGIFKCSKDNPKSLLLLKNVNYDSENEPMIYAEEYIDTEFIRFSMIRQKVFQF